MIRRALVTDAEQISRLFRETILTINRREHNEAQVKAWTLGGDDLVKWGKKIEEQYFILSISEGRIVGFASLRKDGYLDMMFVHKHFQGKGVAASLLGALLKQSLNIGLRTISADVSITAKPFFTKKGFKIIGEQTVLIKDSPLTNFKMQKNIEDTI